MRQTLHNDTQKENPDDKYTCPEEKLLEECFGSMREETLSASYQSVQLAKRKLEMKQEKNQRKHEFIENLLPILLICILHMLTVTFIGICLYLHTSVSTFRFIIISGMITISYIPLLVISMTNLLLKNKEDKEKRECQEFHFS